MNQMLELEEKLFKITIINVLESTGKDGHSEWRNGEFQEGFRNCIKSIMEILKIRNTPEIKNFGKY